MGDISAFLQGYFIARLLVAAIARILFVKMNYFQLLKKSYHLQNLLN